jgi:hypothetical protein
LEIARIDVEMSVKGFAPRLASEAFLTASAEPRMETQQRGEGYFFDIEIC